MGEFLAFFFNLLVPRFFNFTRSLHGFPFGDTNCSASFTMPLFLFSFVTTFGQIGHLLLLDDGDDEDDGRNFCKKMLKMNIWMEKYKRISLFVIFALFSIFNSAFH
jgi:hypothetical protein